MDRNIYNNLSKEINFQIPDIAFDSDSDELIDDGKPIKPYIRPPAEILFGNKDCSDDEEILSMLSRLHCQNGVDKADKTTATVAEPFQESCYEAVETHTEIPYNDIRIPSGLRSFHLTAEVAKASDRVVLAPFGVRDNVDLDKTLDELDLEEDASSFFDDVLADSEDTNNSNNCPRSESDSGLLEKLDQIARQYSNLSQSTRSKITSKMTSTSDRSSLACLFVQAKMEASAKMVVVDLREHVKTWTTDGIPENDAEGGSSSSSDDGAEVSTDLWIGKFRKSKMLAAKKCSVEASSKPVSASTIKENGGSSHDTTIRDCAAVRKQMEPETDKCEELDSHIQVANCAVEASGDSLSQPTEDPGISARVREKIMKIKQQEQQLSRQRQIVADISQKMSSVESHAVLLHEEISFSSQGAPMLLPPLQDNSQLLVQCEVAISPPDQLLTAARVPSPVTSLHLTGLLAQLLSPDSPMPGLLGMQLLARNPHPVLVFLAPCASLSHLRSHLGPSLGPLLTLRPHDPLLTGHVWRRDHAHVRWLSLPPSCPTDPAVNTACLVLHSRLYRDPAVLTSLLHSIFAVHYLCGLRLVYSKDTSEPPKLILAVRGFNAVECMKSLQNSFVMKQELSCSRFEESSHKELVSWFGPRFEVGGPTLTGCVEGAGEDGYHALFWQGPTTAAVIVSGACLDVGWVVGCLHERAGLELASITRISAQDGEVKARLRELGISESTMAGFCSDVAHLLTLRGEMALHALQHCLEECRSIVGATVSVDQLFYSLPYSNQVLDILDLQSSVQIPEVRQTSVQLPEPPHEDCEQYSFMLLVSAANFTRHLAQLLDQLSQLDLLAVKCLSPRPLPHDHTALLETIFKLRLPLPPSRLAILVLRGLYLPRELSRIQADMALHKNLILAYTLSTYTTFSLVGSFFTPSELVSDPRRRSFLRYVQPSMARTLSENTIETQFRVMYSPLSSILWADLDGAEFAPAWLRKLWFLLSREGFCLEQAILGGSRLLVEIKRPNGIFYLTRWTETHFGAPVDRIGCAQTPNEVDKLQTEICRVRSDAKNRTHLFMSGLEKSRTYGLLILLHESLLDTSLESLAANKPMWNFLENNGLNCCGLQTIVITGALVFKLGSCDLTNLKGDNIRQEGKYLTLLVRSEVEAVFIGDLMRSQFGPIHLSPELWTKILFSFQVELCCDILNEESSAIK